MGFGFVVRRASIPKNVNQCMYIDFLFFFYVCVIRVYGTAYISSYCFRIPSYIYHHPVLRIVISMLIILALSALCLSLYGFRPTNLVFERVGFASYDCCSIAYPALYTCI